MSNSKSINLGGINGLGEGLINTNSNEFLALQAAIKRMASGQSEEEQLENAFLSIRFRMESYLSSATDELIPAGSFIEQFLEVIQVKKKDFASYIGF